MATEQTQAKRKGMNTRDALVFLVDWRTPMIQKDAEINNATDLCATTGTSSLLSITLRCIADVMKSKIISHTNDYISVIAFGTRHSKSSNKWPGIRIIQPLLPSNASAIKKLQSLAKRLEQGEADHLTQINNNQQIDSIPIDKNDEDFCFGSDKQVEFDKALWAVRHQFTNLSSSRYDVVVHKKVFIFTNDEDPARNNAAIYQLCSTQAKDLTDLGAILDVSILKSPCQVTDTQQELQTLEISKFFNDLVYADEEISNETRGNVLITTIYSFQDLYNRIRKKEMTKRALRKTILVLGTDYKIGIGLYSLIKKATRPTKIELVATTNKPLFKVTTHTCAAYGEILKPSAIRHMPMPEYLKNSNRFTSSERTKIINEQGFEALKNDGLLFGFTKSELVKAKAIGKVGLHLYGFTHKNRLRKEENLTSSIFVFPDDTEYIGSTKAFAVLLKCMIKRDVIGIVSVRLTETQGTGMRFAALVPQQEKFSDDMVEQLVPGGFHLIYLPFKDDIYTDWRKFFNENNLENKQDMKMEDDEENEQEQKLVVKQEDLISGELTNQPTSVSISRRMIKKLKIEEYHPEAFLNPDLQRFYAGLEHAAGVETNFKPIDDLLNPKTEKMQQRVGHLITELKRLTVGIDYDGETIAKRFKTLASKRAAEMSEKSLRKAQEKVQAIKIAAEECNVEDYINAYENGNLEKFRVVDLKLYCRAHGLSERGIKKNLLILVEEDIKQKLKKK